MRGCNYSECFEDVFEGGSVGVDEDSEEGELVVFIEGLVQRHRRTPQVHLHRRLRLS